MKKRYYVLIEVLIMFLFGCSSHNGFKEKSDVSGIKQNVLFIHHSTGNNIYNGNLPNGKPSVKVWFDSYNKNNKSGVNFVEVFAPKNKKYRFFGYGGNNYPFDYYNIWVKCS